MTDQDKPERDAMSTVETADELGVSPKTLENWRAIYKDGYDKDGNPVPPEFDLPFFKVGSMIRYSRKDVLAFKAANRSQKKEPINYAKPKRKRSRKP
jgi:hypothetical protein